MPSRSRHMSALIRFWKLGRVCDPQRRTACRSSVRARFRACITQRDITGMVCCWRPLLRQSFRILSRDESPRSLLILTARRDLRRNTDRNLRAFVSLWFIPSCIIFDVMSSIADKVIRGERLSFEEGVELYRSNDILALGHLANHTRERLNGNLVYYNVNRHINYTNVCVIDCQLCQGAYARKPGQEGGYTMQLEQVFHFAEQESSDSLTEFHIVGGLNPDLPFDYYLDLLRGLNQRFPSVHLKAFTMVELDFFTKITRRPLDRVIQELHTAGMDSCPGGGAEIFAERARPLIAGHKISGTRWLEVARTVHKMGIRSNATMLYGHIETMEERVDHLARLRELQDETGGFNCFIPLAFHPEHTVYANLPPTTGLDDLKTIAVSRLILDNFSHIKAYWITLTPSLAQIALGFGADDLDGTIIEERIIHGAGTPTDCGMTRKGIEKLIRDAGRTPVERDTLYNPIQRVSELV